MTLHQPGSDILPFIQHLILMKNGSICYDGEHSKVLDYLSMFGYNIPEFFNPFDFYISSLEEDSKKNDEMITAFQSNFQTSLIKEMNEIAEVSDNKVDVVGNSIKKNSNNWFLELWLLCQREFINVVRNGSLIRAQLIQVLSLTLILGSFYWKSGAEEDAKVVWQNMTGSSFNFVNNFYITAMFISIFRMPQIKKVFCRESAAKLYRSSTFYLSQVLSLSVFALWNTLFLGTALYYAIDFNTDFSHLLMFYAILMLMFLSGMLVGLALGIFFEEKVCLAIGPLSFLIFMVGSGFFRQQEKMSVYVRWLNRVSMFKYYLEMILKNQSNFSNLTESLPATLGYDEGLDLCWMVSGVYALSFFILGYIGMLLLAKNQG